MVNGKQKGNSFERTIANRLSERFAAFTGIEKPFRRNPDSGSFFGGTNVSRSNVYDTDWAIYGDLICPKNFKFSVECKHYKEAPIFNAIATGDVKQWDEWLAQAQQDAKQSGKRMMLIMRYNRTDILVFLDWKPEDDIDENAANPEWLLPSNLPSTITYKGAHLYSLEDLLKYPDQFFFEQNK